VVSSSRLSRFIRSRPWTALGSIVVLLLGGLAAGRVIFPSCPAQDQEVARAQVGLVLLAGDVSDPACRGKLRLRPAHHSR